jgi:hypothetical protein
MKVIATVRTTAKTMMIVIVIENVNGVKKVNIIVRAVKEIILVMTTTMMMMAMTQEVKIVVVTNEDDDVKARKRRAVRNIVRVVEKVMTKTKMTGMIAKVVIIDCRNSLMMNE